MNTRRSLLASSAIFTQQFTKLFIGSVDRGLEDLPVHDVNRSTPRQSELPECLTAWNIATIDHVQGFSGSFRFHSRALRDSEPRMPQPKVYASPFGAICCANEKI